MKKINRALSVLLCICLAIVPLCFSASASSKQPLSIDAGTTLLRLQFEGGSAPQTNGFNIDYVYYSPVQSGSGDTTKYPLVVWLHGLLSGVFPGQQIIRNEIANWSSAEFQSRFYNQGAYIFAPRLESTDYASWGSEILEPIKASIDYFISKNSGNIDTSRIYIGGYSMGGKLTMNMISTYPEMFAAAFPIAPTYEPTNAELNHMAATPIWLIASNKDEHVSYEDVIVPSWNYLMSKSTRRADCRLSVFSQALYTDGSDIGNYHYIWFAPTNDMFTDDNTPYFYMTTIDGENNPVTLTYPNGLISWLSRFSTTPYTGTTSETNPVTRGMFSMILDLVKALIQYFFNNLLF